jgi:hypothetical protein
MARAANTGSRKGKKIVKRHGPISHESLPAARLKLAMPFDQDLVTGSCRIDRLRDLCTTLSPIMSLDQLLSGNDSKPFEPALAFWPY